MGINKRLRFILETLGMTIREAADKSGVSYRSWQNYLSGLREPNAEALQLIGTHLGVSLDWLLTGEGSMLRDTNVTSVTKPAQTHREEAILALFRELEEEDQREIQSAAEEKKRLKTLEQRLSELEAVVSDIKKMA